MKRRKKRKKKIIKQVRFAAGGEEKKNLMVTKSFGNNNTCKKACNGCRSSENFCRGRGERIVVLRVQMGRSRLTFSFVSLFLVVLEWRLNFCVFVLVHAWKKFSGFSPKGSHNLTHHPQEQAFIGNPGNINFWHYIW